MKKNLTKNQTINNYTWRTRTFDLPTHPTRGRQKIVVERNLELGCWQLVIDKNKAKPLPLMVKEPRDAKEVLDAFAKTYGDMNVFQFISGGYSR